MVKSKRIASAKHVDEKWSQANMSTRIIIGAVTLLLIGYLAGYATLFMSTLQIQANVERYKGAVDVMQKLCPETTKPFMTPPESMKE